MKAQHFFHRTINKLKTPLCGSTSTTSGLRPFSQWRRWLIHVKTQCRNLALVSLTCLGGRLASLKSQLLIILKEVISNQRFVCGVGIVMVAPVMFWGYRFFDIDARDLTWYYVNWSFFTHIIREELAGIFLALGLFIASPQKWAFRWFLVPVAVFCAIEIYLIWGYDDWRDFYTAMPAWEWVAIFATCVPALFFSANYLLYRKYHLKDGNTARISGILRAPGISIEQRFKLLEQLIEEQENYNARI